MILGNADMFADGDTIIGTLKVGGEFNNISKNTTVSGKLDVKKDANITVEDNAVIADGHMEQDLNVVTQNILIKEIKLDGNINADVNNVNINTSNDLNIGYILSNENIYTDNVKISSAKSITNGSGADDTIIYAKDIDLTAGDSIGRIDKMINIGLHEDNSIAVEAGNSLNINTVGAKANYTKLIGNEANIIADKSVKVRNMNVNYIELKTESANADIKGKVNKEGNIRTKDKRIAITNVNLKPDYSATAQLHTARETFHLVLNASNNIEVDSKFVVRHGQDIVINGFDFNSSMESEAIKAGETNRKNSNKRKNMLEDADDILYEIEELSDDSILIRTIHGEIVAPENVYDVINSGNSLSENFRKFKKKA